MTWLRRARCDELHDDTEFIPSKVNLPNVFAIALFVKAYERGFSPNAQCETLKENPSALQRILMTVTILCFFLGTILKQRSTDDDLKIAATFATPTK